MFLFPLYSNTCFFKRKTQGYPKNNRPGKKSAAQGKMLFVWSTNYFPFHQKNVSFASFIPTSLLNFVVVQSDQSGSSTLPTSHRKAFSVSCSVAFGFCYQSEEIKGRKLQAKLLRVRQQWPIGSLQLQWPDWTRQEIQPVAFWVLSPPDSKCFLRALSPDGYV